MDDSRLGDAGKRNIQTYKDDDVKAVFYLQDSDNTHSVLLKVRRTSLDATAYTETYAPISR